VDGVAAETRLDKIDAALVTGLQPARVAIAGLLEPTPFVWYSSPRNSQ
jgi:hypothetical protein